jgi:hypothetical protein
MADVVYGFVDSKNLLIGIAYFVDGDTPTIERVKQEYKADAYYKVDEARQPPVVNNSIWTGTYFTPGCRYTTWTWDTATENWVPPVPYPSGDKNYEWSDEAVNWVEVTE